VWATALAMLLVVSLGLNVWWGVLRFGPRPAGDLDRAGRLGTFQFQAGMVRAKDLGTLIAAHPARWDPTTIAGFTPQAERTAFFGMGTLYADALAAVQGGAIEAARQRLDILTQVLVHVQAPRETLGALERLRPLVAREALTDQDMQAIRAPVQDIQGMLSD
jgi:hypothetical protein